MESALEGLTYLEILIHLRVARELVFCFCFFVWWLSDTFLLNPRILCEKGCSLGKASICYADLC